ncbi:hypothetical protein evm_009425 [Chilo suppressalis]|nr:hypothetical protein evm_009425 [Chilo suppressalis]
MSYFQLPNHLFEELVMDIYDEIDRRETEAIWQTSATGLERCGVVFLPVNPALSAPRNQGRQKLARLSTAEMATLLRDVLVDATRRQHIATLQPRGSWRFAACCHGTLALLARLALSLGPYQDSNSGPLRAESAVVALFDNNHHHHQPINVTTAGAQAFPMDAIGRLGHDPPRGPSTDWWVLTTADPRPTA